MDPLMSVLAFLFFGFIAIVLLVIARKNQAFSPPCRSLSGCAISQEGEWLGG